MPGKLKLTTADIGALIEARHPEPRSLLGYHEVRRGKALAHVVVTAVVTDTAGKHVELATLMPDGTYAEPAEVEEADHTTTSTDAAGGLVVAGDYAIVDEEA